MMDRLRKLTADLMLIPGLSGHEDRVRRALAKELAALGLSPNRTASEISSPPSRATQSSPASCFSPTWTSLAWSSAKSRAMA